MIKLIKYFDIIKTSSPSVLGGVSIILLQLSLIYFLTSEQGAIAVGLYTYTLSLYSALKIFDIFGTAHSARFLAMYKERVKITRLLMNILLINVVYYISIVMVFQAVLEFFISGQDIVNNYYVITIMVTYLIANSVYNGLVGVFDFFNRTFIRCYASILVSLILISVTVLGHASITPFHCMMIIAVFYLAVDIILILFIIVNLTELQRELGLVQDLSNRMTALHMTKYALKIYFSTVSGVVFDPVFKFLLGHYSGLDRLGLYEISIRSVSVLKTLSNFAFAPFIPRFVIVSDYAGSVRYLKNVTAVTALLASGLIAILMMYANMISIVLLGDYDIIFISIFQVSCVAYLVNIVMSPLFLFMQANSYVKWNNVGQISIAVISLLGFLIVSDTFRVYLFLCGLSIGSIVSGSGNLFNLYTRKFAR